MFILASSTTRRVAAGNRSHRLGRSKPGLPHVRGGGRVLEYGWMLWWQVPTPGPASRGSAWKHGGRRGSVTRWRGGPPPRWILHAVVTVGVCCCRRPRLPRSFCCRWQGGGRVAGPRPGSLLPSQTLRLRLACMVPAAACRVAGTLIELVLLGLYQTKAKPHTTYEQVKKKAYTWPTQSMHFDRVHTPHFSMTIGNQWNLDELFSIYLLSWERVMQRLES